ncbi:hypothetical protein ZWY2020_036871 [Hordeum vulgare]|nr:hypothetical protein ZWY2020_036871 [Hordeum vulgare]
MWMWRACPPPPSPPHTATKLHSHILKFQGHSHTKLLIDGSSLESKAFEAGGCTWRIVFYPNGTSSTADDDDRTCVDLSPQPCRQLRPPRQCPGPVQSCPSPRRADPGDDALQQLPVDLSS